MLLSGSIFATDEEAEKCKGNIVNPTSAGKNLNDKKKKHHYYPFDESRLRFRENMARAIEDDNRKNTAYMRHDSEEFFKLFSKNSEKNTRFSSDDKARGPNEPAIGPIGRFISGIFNFMNSDDGLVIIFCFVCICVLFIYFLLLYKLIF